MWYFVGVGGGLDWTGERHIIPVLTSLYLTVNVNRNEADQVLYSVIFDELSNVRETIVAVNIFFNVYMKNVHILQDIIKKTTKTVQHNQSEYSYITDLKQHYGYK